MVQIYKKKYYCIYSSSKNSRAYIVHNKHKDFSSGHTHINNYKTAKFIIDMSLTKTVPTTKVSDYIIDSIIRISEDKSYIEKLQKLKKKK